MTDSERMAALVLLLAALLAVLTLPGWWGLLGLWPAVSALALFILARQVRAPRPPRGRAYARPVAVVAPSPVTTAPGRGSMILAAERKDRDRQLEWELEAGALERAPESHPYPNPGPPLVSPAGWLGALEGIMAGTTRTAPTYPFDDEAEGGYVDWEDDEPFTLIEPDPRTTRIPEGWLIYQPGPRTPPRLYSAPPPAVTIEAPRDPLGIDPPAEAEAYNPFATMTFCVPVEISTDPHKSNCPECGRWGRWGFDDDWCHDEYDAALNCPREGWYPGKDERLADTDDISVITTNADYAAELDEQERAHKDYLAAMERDAYNWASQFARSLKR